MPVLDIRAPLLDKKEKEKFELMAKTVEARMKPIAVSMVEFQKRFNEVNLEPIRAMQENVKKLAESFAPPSGLIEVLRETGEQVKMAQRLGSIGFPKVTLDYYLPKPAIGLIVPRSEHLLAYQNQLLEELVGKQEAKTHPKPYEYYPETKTFITSVLVYGAINFSTRGRTDSISILFEVLYEILEERGKIENGYKVIFATADEIIQKSIQKGKEDVNMNWLKHTRSNLVNSKIPQRLKEIVKISEYDRLKKGYYFKIRVGDYLVN